MKTIHDNNYDPHSEYSTTDIALAAYLYSEGFELAFVDESKFPATFIFKNDSPKLTDCIALWERAKAEGNLFQFYRSYKTMIARIKDGNGGNNRRSR